MWTSIKLKWRDIQPSMVTHTRNACFAFTHPSAHTQQWKHTHHEHTPREQLGVRCLSQGHLSRGIEGGESAVHSLPPPTIPSGSRDSNLQPFDYESNSLPLGHYFPVLVIPNISKCKLQQMFVCFAFPFAPIAKYIIPFHHILSKRGKTNQEFDYVCRREKQVQFPQLL